MDPNDFPLSIIELEGTSTETRKSVIAAYGFSYQQFAKIESKMVHNFIVHDVLENIEEEQERLQIIKVYYDDKLFERTDLKSSDILLRWKGW